MAVTAKESQVYKNNDILLHRSIVGITIREEVLEREICELHMSHSVYGQRHRLNQVLRTSYSDIHMVGFL